MSTDIFNVEVSFYNIFGSSKSTHNFPTMTYIKSVEKDSHSAILRKRNAKKKGPIRMILLGAFALASFDAVNDYAEYLQTHRSLCEVGKSEEALQLANERKLTSSMIAYIDNVVNGDVVPCDTAIPEIGIFDEYPPIIHNAGLIPNRPQGTMAYAFTITRCPEFYTSGVEGTPDPGENIFEATAIIKNEICTIETMDEDLAALGHTL